jgi:hypothetical protein
VAGSPPLDFVLDSGANRSSISDPQLATVLGLEVTEVGIARGVGPGAVGVLITEPTTLASNGSQLLTVSLAVHDIGQLLAARAGREIDGFLGRELFDNYVVEVDPIRRLLRLHEPSSFIYHGSGKVLPLEVQDGRAVVRARVNVSGKTTVVATLLVDTGSSRYLTLIAGGQRQLVPPTDQGRTTSVGVTGTTSVKISRVVELELGELVAYDVETAWVEPHQIAAARAIPRLDGVIGNRLLSRFTVYFDYHQGRLILEPLSEKPDIMIQ